MIKQLWCYLTGHRPHHHKIDEYEDYPDGYIDIAKTKCLDCGKKLTIQYVVRHTALGKTLDFRDITNGSEFL